MAQSNKLFQLLLTFSVLLTTGFSHPLFSQDLFKNQLFTYTEVDIKPTLQSKKYTQFSEWIIDKIDRKNISFQDKTTTEFNLYNNYVFKDAIKKYCKVNISFTVKTNGKLTDIEVEESTHPILKQEVEKVLATSPKWNAGYHDKRKVDTRIRTSLIFELEGEPVMLEQAPVYNKDNSRKNGGKDSHLTLYLYDLANAINRFQHENNTLRKHDSNDIHGKLEISFLIDKNGEFNLLEEKQDLSPIDYVRFHQMSSEKGGLFDKKTKWEPAMINGKPASIKVIAIFDFDQQVFGWDGYVTEE